MSTGSRFPVLNFDQIDHYATSMTFIIWKVSDPVTKELHKHFEGKYKFSPGC